MRSRIAGVVALAALTCGCVSSATTTAATKEPEPVSLARMIGQLMLVRMQGRVPNRELPVARSQRRDWRRRALCGQLWTGGAGGADCRNCKRIAAAGGQPRLLIAIDQEGGVVRRLPGAPSLAPRQMTNARIAEAQGRATARNLKSYGIDVDLAPVLDVGRGGFITERASARRPSRSPTVAWRSHRPVLSVA